MIKILKNKFLICLFLLVTLFSVASSCYAVEYNSEHYIDTVTPTGVWRFSCNVPFYLKPEVASNGVYYWSPYDFNGKRVYISLYCDGVDYWKKEVNQKVLGLPATFNAADFSGNGSVFVYNLSGNVFWSTEFDFFDYSITGVKRGQTKLTINNLNTAFRMYGYVGLSKTFNVGDTLDITSNTDYLRLLAMYSDNSDLYCYLRHGENLKYYIVDKNNLILDTGNISEMAVGDFVYGFSVNGGVDFVFLRNGEVYWDNDLTLEYSSGSSNVFENNDITSMGQGSYIPTNPNSASGSYTVNIYDSNGKLLSSATTDYSNDLSSMSIDVKTSYFEVETLVKHYSCYWLKTIYLSGTDSSGNDIDFSDYYVTWSVPSWVNFDKVELFGDEYNKRSGTLNGFTSEGVLSMFNLKLYEYLNEHTKNFDITFQVYDDNDSLVLTHIINSDDIVSKQIASEENNVEKGDYGIISNPSYTGGSNNSSNINNIQNWTADDYLNLMSTDNFVWEFFKAILGNLPWWITTPLTILLFGVVIITIIRFARGA